MRGGVKGHSDWWRSGDLGGSTADQDGRWIAGSFKMAQHNESQKKKDRGLR